MPQYLPTPADHQGAITPIESQGRYAVATFELFAASTDALDDLASHAKSERPLRVTDPTGGGSGLGREPKGSRSRALPMIESS